MTVTIDGENLNIEQLHAVAYEKAQVKITPQAIERVKECNNLLLKLVDDGLAIYGVTTGIGEFARIKVSKEMGDELQKRIVYSHAAGVGRPVPLPVVRGAMLLRSNTLCKGISGVRPLILETLVQMLNKDVVPFVHERGSLGVSGDLSPMAQIAEVVIGEGRAYYKGELLDGGEAMKRAGIEPVTLTYKEGLGLINGTQMVTALSGLLLYEAERVFKTAQIASAMTIDVLKSVESAFDPRLHAVRPFTGQNTVAKNLRKLFEGSEIMADKSGKVQDGYSLRCTPQVLGPVWDGLNYARSQVETEMNSGVDNPVFITKDEVYLAGGNFHGQPIGVAMDLLGIIMSIVGNLSERHTNRLMNPVLSGLPDFLVEGKGLNSGLMVAQYTAAALVSENKTYAHPATVDSIPVSADQEDFVAMAPGAAFTAREIINNLSAILAIEMYAAAQAMDFRKPQKPGKGTLAAYHEIRKVVDFLKDDRVLYPDINIIADKVKDNSILDAVEKEIGKLD